MKKKLIYSLLLSSLILTACSQQSTSDSSTTEITSTSNSSSTTTAVSTKTTEYYGNYEEEDLVTDYDEASATKITLSDDSTVDGEGVTVEDQTVTITKAGTYVISGSLSNGQLVVSAGKEDKVRLIFEDVSITNSGGPAVTIQSAEKVITTLVKGTTTTLKDGSDYQLAADETEPDATFYSKEDLVINGEGTLNVEGNYSNGIRSKDDLVLISGTYTVTAKNNALKGKDAVSIRDGEYTLTTTEGDAIQANNTEDTSKGYIAIDGGTFTISSGRDGIQAETNVSIQNAEMSIKTADGAASQSLSTEESYKGLKAGSKILVSSGTYTIDSADDALHSNDTAEITGGEFTIATGDDGIHADNELTISDGTLAISESYEGIEASVIAISGGDIQVTASDDGLNAGGGSDTDEGTGQFGADSFGGGGAGGDQADDSKSLTISGGTLAVNAEGDGLDSNGNITMSGGTVTVDGPTNGGNGALDYGGTFDLSGGTLIAAGSSGMAQNISDSSTQAAVGIYFDSSQAANTLVSIVDSDGNTVATFKPSKTYQFVAISTPEMTQGKTYTIVSGGSTDAQDTNGLYETGTETNGDELGSFELSDIVTNVSQSGEMVSGSQMGGGPGGH